MAEQPHPDRNTTGPVTEAEAELERHLREVTLGEYDILARLGTGGMASVYLAHDLALDRRVAIKVLSPAMVYGPGLVERFRQEARTAAALSHPNIIPVYAVRETDGLLFFVMKVIEGTSLDAIIAEMGPMPFPMIAAILAQVGGALGYAHRHGVVHRDIKPANILLDEEGWVVVTDFGIAKVTEASSLTLTGMSVGTPTYMSPEQCADGEISGATDQYSLGVVSYEMIVGKPPFGDASVPALMVGHATRPPPPIAAGRPDCPPRLLAAVERMLSKDPADRFESVEAAVAAAEAVPLPPDDPTRDTLVALARNGSTRSLISQIQTPRSPVPMVHRSGRQTRNGGNGTGRKGLWYAGGIVGLGAVIAMVVFGLRQPRQQPAAITDPATTPAESTTRAAIGTDQPVTDNAEAQVVPPDAPGPQPDRDRRQAAPPPPPPPPPLAAAKALVPVPGVSADPRDDTANNVGGRARPDSTPVGQPTRVPDTSRATAPPPAPPPAPSAPPPAAATPDPTVEIRSVIQSYAAALENGQLGRAIALFPTMPADQRAGLRAFHDDGGTMVTKWGISQIRVSGDDATLNISGTTTIRSSGGSERTQSVSLRASLHREAGAWRLTSLGNR